MLAEVLEVVLDLAPGDQLVAGRPQQGQNSVPEAS